jgi:hypothetical protein
MSRPLIALTLAAVAFRAVLIAVGVPPTNSDEATMGLAAVHVAAGHDQPVWFYGQAYMGTLEAYLAAPFVALFGPHTAVLRLPLLPLYAAFLLLMFGLTRALFSTGLAWFTVALLALGADRVVKNELIAAGGYPEILPAAALLFLLAWWLARTRGEAGPKRLAAFAAWGLTAGLCLWVDWLVLPYVGAAAVVLVAGCGRELLRRAGLVLAGAVVLGAAPALVYNLTAPPGRDSLTVFAQLSSSGHAGLGTHLYGGVVLGIPFATGLCGPSHCAAPVLGWGVVYLVLLAVAVGMAVAGVRRSTGPARVAHVARLALLGGAALTIVAYVRSGSPVQDPVESARYLHCLLVSTPAVLWPVWRLAGMARRARWVGAAVLAALLVGALAATVALVAHVPAYARLGADQRDLIAALDRLGANRIYSDYWTCGRITFATGERVACAVLADDLRPGLNRYGAYERAVDAAPHPAFALPSGSVLDRAFAARLADRGIAASTVDAGGYTIYLP